MSMAYQPGSDDPSPSLHFACTSCGKCCTGLRLPLSVSEAITWLERGGRVEILCDAAPDMPFPEGSAEAYRAARAVPAISDQLPLTLSATLTAVFEGPCPNLQADMRCGAYEIRPNACRIYPAEVRPDRRVVPTEKLCPSDAWDDAHPTFMEPAQGVLDMETANAITRSRHAGIDDVGRKAGLLAALHIDQAALANEGYAIWKPSLDTLLDRLRAVRDAQDGTAPDRLYVEILSPRAETRQMIAEAQGVDAVPDSTRGYDYLPLYG
ncbi:YkgJ family cysteine cluster protein [Sphingobium sp.]|uniref:YkgJ family cysteine cluster protein n=1 Tax=Sphingobium sp. TaxID=1912891 RepID=UPI0026248681|nr:YkgJ family cysteine cluster protein [Sphingobium sp.]